MSLTSKEKIIRNLRIEYRGGNNYSSPAFDFLIKPNSSLEKSFEEKITGLNGKFIHCTSISDLHEKLVQLLSQKKEAEIVCIEENIRNILPPDLSVASSFSEKGDIAITGCEYLVAQTGSVIVSTTQIRSRKVFAYPTIHIVIANKANLIGELSDSITLISEKYINNLPSQITVITGPSRTADIEKTLVMGAHGPKEVIIFYLDQ